MVGLILGGVVGGGVLFWIRQARVKARFMEEHEEQIVVENDRIAEQWRASKPSEKYLQIRREFTPPVLIPPTIVVKKKYRRDPSFWQRLFG